MEAMIGASASIALAAVFLFLVLYASPAQCRGGLLEVGSAMRRHPSNNNATTTGVVNSTALDASKVTVKFCILSTCKGADCYCCLNGEYCAPTRKECQAICPSCNPKCPQSSLTHGQYRRGLLEVGSAMRRHPSNNNATTTGVVNSTALDASKVTVKFCILSTCKGADCYCCLNGEYCAPTRKECQAICPSCNPNPNSLLSQVP